MSNPSQEISVGGLYTIGHYRDGELIGVLEEANIIPNVGLNLLLNYTFNTNQQMYFGANGGPTTNCISFFTNDYTPTLTDTVSSIVTTGGELTFSGYTTRINPFPAGGSGISFSSKQRSTDLTSLTINTSTTLYGIFLIVSVGSIVNIVGNTANGVLLSAMRFGSPISITSGDVLTVRYTLGVSSS